MFTVVRNGLEHGDWTQRQDLVIKHGEGTKPAESAKQKPKVDIDTFVTLDKRKSKLDSDTIVDDDDLAEVDSDTFVKLRSSPRKASRRRRFVDTTPSVQTQHEEEEDGRPIPIDC